jgi:hypothetical protein
MQEDNKALWGLLCRRQCHVPTLRGWLVLGLGLILLAVVAALEINPFLSITDERPGGVLVVEGWAPDYALRAAIAEFSRNHYEKLYVTGGPIDQGAPLSEYGTYAELGTATLLKMGLSTNLVQAVPAPWVRQDRTYTSAVCLRSWWREHASSPTKVNLITVGAHARRSRLLFEKALGKGVAVGVIAVQDNEFDMAHWWRSSAGVRTVLSEALAYGYARFLFYPRRD